jgi:DNA repair protein RecN (Recombination protein N)
MLTELRISNFALIDHLHLEFSKGFLAFTGETGAGKSLLVDALDLLTGGRASANHIRSQAEEAVLEAAFVIPGQSFLAIKLREEHILPPGESELIIRRILSRSGRNRIFLNGNLTSLQTVQEVGGALIDIHGQHDQQSLLAPAAQLEVLDMFGQAKGLRIQCRNAYGEWRAKQENLEKALAEESQWKSQKEFLQFQYQELQDAHLQIGEDDALAQEYQRFKHARQIGELAEQAYQALYGGDQPILEQIQIVKRCTDELGEIDKTVTHWNQLCEAASVHLQELAEGLRDYRQDLEYDPARLAEIDSRLAKLQQLKKKYGATLKELVEKTICLGQKLEDLSQSRERIEELNQEIAQAHLRLEDLAKELSRVRHQAAEMLEQRIEKEFSALGMDHFQFRVEFGGALKEGDIGQTGMDRVEFLLSANPGEPLHPLAKVASGGELSRVMLAIKTVLAEADQVPVLVFDEIDTGIGGKVAGVIGERLQTLAQYHQVFCITHLPQIASQATTQYLIQKEVVKIRTVTLAKALKEVERENEIARMLGGQKITQTVRQAAAEMLKPSPLQKKKSP